MRKYRIENYGIYKKCGWITIKTFVASDICTDSIDYAKACAQELLDKLREELP